MQEFARAVLASLADRLPSPTTGLNIRGRAVGRVGRLWPKGLGVSKRRVTRRVTRTKRRAAVPIGLDVLTTEQAATLLQVSEDTMLDLDVPWFAAGEGKKRPRRRYLRASVLEWCRRREAAA